MRIGHMWRTEKIDSREHFLSLKETQLQFSGNLKDRHFLIVYSNILEPENNNNKNFCQEDLIFLQTTMTVRLNLTLR